MDTFPTVETSAQYLVCHCSANALCTAVLWEGNDSICLTSPVRFRLSYFVWLSGLAGKTHHLVEDRTRFSARRLKPCCPGGQAIIKNTRLPLSLSTFLSSHSTAHTRFGTPSTPIVARRLRTGERANRAASRANREDCQVRAEGPQGEGGGSISRGLLGPAARAGRCRPWPS